MRSVAAGPPPPPCNKSFHCVQCMLWLVECFRSRYAENAWQMEFLNRFWSNFEIGSWTTQLVNSESRTSWAFEHREQGENAQFVQHKPTSSWFITIVCQSSYITPLHRSGLALLGGMHPICQKGAKNLFGIGYGLIHSVLETPKAPTHPHPWRRGVAGISTSKDKNHVTAPLVSKGDIVERFVLTWLILFQIHSITYLC